MLKVRTEVEFWNLNEIESNKLEFYEIEFIVLNLEHRNQVYCTWDISFLNSFKNMLTNKIVWKSVLFWKKIQSFSSSSKF